MSEVSPLTRPYTVMPDGRTVAEHALPAVEAAVHGGVMPTRLLAIEAGG